MSEISIMRARMIKYLKVLLITIKGFANDKVSLQATSLSYFSAMSIVPFVAIMFAVTNGFGAGERLESLLYSYFEGNEQIISYVLKFATNIIKTSRNGLFGVISFLFLLSTIIWLMLNIEKAFNEIWKVESGRSFRKRAIYYMTLLFVSPFVIFLFLTLALVYTNTLKSIGLEFDKYLPITSIFTWITAYFFITGVFTLMYKLIPNTKVRVSAAFNSALVLAFAFIVVQFFYLETQLMVNGLNAVYGVFAAIPLFMVWMNISWTLILFGAELSHAFQNVDNYKYI
ncbi:MAG: YihY/virulence factor BrkB family protein [Bacteroidales bacterium]|nr:YihY/virulence factor BrkB family protein [Bacteroidales bacterium]MDD4618267.1 YihY/virulence factor BrkB family protein [Bacteroidales bacterium]